MTGGHRNEGVALIINQIWSAGPKCTFVLIKESINEHTYVNKYRYVTTRGEVG